MAACDRAMAGLPREESSPGNEAVKQDPFRAVRASAWLMRGRILAARDTPEAVVEALRCFDQAILRMAAGADGEKTELAMAWMNRGSALLKLGAPEAVKESVRSYDQAVGLLETAPAEFQNALGAALMNKGAGLSHLGGDEALSEALVSLERAVATLEPLAAAQPEARRNLASAWANRGQALGLKDERVGAVAACRQAVEAFRPLVSDQAPESRRELAALLLNLGQAAGAAAGVESALTALRESLALVLPVESANLHAAQLALRVRHAMGVILGGLLANDRVSSATRSARLEEAGDLVEDGLSLVRSLEGARVPLASGGLSLFEFGAWFYRTQQPQFLAEFLLEHMEADSARAEIAAMAVKQARQAVVQRGFSDGTSGLEQTAAILAGLGEVEARLRAIATAAAANQSASA